MEKTPRAINEATEGQSSAQSENQAQPNGSTIFPNTGTQQLTANGPVIGSANKEPQRNDTPTAPNIRSPASSLIQPLPELPYSLRDHKRNIFIIWTLLAIDSAILPIVLFYPLWYGTDLRPAIVFAITTAVFGIVSGLEWGYRTWRLWREEWVRPIGGTRLQFDFFHYSYSIGYTVALVRVYLYCAVVGVFPLTENRPN